MRKMNVNRAEIPEAVYDGYESIRYFGYGIHTGIPVNLRRVVEVGIHLFVVLL